MAIIILGLFQVFGINLIITFMRIRTENAITTNIMKIYPTASFAKVRNEVFGLAILCLREL